MNRLLHASRVLRARKNRVLPLIDIWGAAQLALDVDARACTLTGANLITAVQDQSSHNFGIAPPAAAQRPTLVAGAIDGWPAIDFLATASRERLRTSGTTFNLLGASALFRVYIVANFDTFPVAGTGVFDVSVNATAVSYASLHRFNATDDAGYRLITNPGPAEVNTYMPPDPAYLQTGWRLYWCDVSAAALTAYRGLTSLKTGSLVGKTMVTGANRVTIGALADSNFPMDGQIARLAIVLNPTAEQHTQTIQYLDRMFPSLNLL